MVTPIDNDGRKIRGYAIISKGDTPERISGSTYRIPSQSGKGVYIITIKQRRSECNCQDWKNRQLDNIRAYEVFDVSRAKENNQCISKISYQSYF